MSMSLNPDGTPKKRLEVSPDLHKGEVDVGPDGVRWFLMRAGGTFDSDNGARSYQLVT